MWERRELLCEEERRGKVLSSPELDDSQNSIGEVAVQ